MRRFVPILIAGLALIASACGDAIAPTRSTESSLGRFNGPLSASKDAYVPDFATRVQVTIPAAGGTIAVGDYLVYFSPRAVCDPATSGYGPDTWDLPCTTIETDYTLPAAYWTENGVSFVEFLDDLRFDPNNLVVILAKAPDTTSRIDYFKRDMYGTLIKVDEAQVDESMTTFFDAQAGFAFRRIKHFTGYLVSSGKCEEDPTLPECQGGPGEGI